MKADSPRTMSIVARLDQADYRIICLYHDAALTTNWQQFRYVFTAQNPAAQHTRIAFNLGNAGGTVSTENLQIHAGVDGAGLPPGQSLLKKAWTSRTSP